MSRFFQIYAVRYIKNVALNFPSFTVAVMPMQLKSDAKQQQQQQQQ